ncbi:UDP-N-acetylglucosamine--N-acetylmuramyl-(pentapeptide) pyrophosphoryl-undecaprenol N-acetylglucosamine transferase [Jatrophihabitans sp. YIM 134969]
MAGGHSAGHIEPALNVGDAIRAADSRAVVTALGTTRGLDTTLIPARGYPLELISPVPFPRKPGKDMLTVPLRARAAVNETAEVLDRLHADVVVGFGGYVALPAYLAARKRKIPIVVHEANAGAGLANKVGARLTPYVFTAGPGIDLPHAHPVGIPLRASIAHLDRPARRAGARAGFGLDPDRPTLLVTGGSQGAQAVNAAVLGAERAFVAAGVQVLHVVGPKNATTAPERAPGEAPYVVVPFVENMADAYAAADFVVCRSGAMTVAELSAVGLPAAYVPLPLRGGEQGRNATAAVAAGGALVVDNERFDADYVRETVLPILTDPPLLASMSAKAEGSGSRDAAQHIAKKALWLAVKHASGEY